MELAKLELSVYGLNIFFQLHLLTLNIICHFNYPKSFVSCILFNTLTVTPRKINVYALFFHNYSQESMFSYLFCECFLGNTDLNPSRSFTSFQMDAFLLCGSTAHMYEASPLEHNMELIMCVHYLLHTLNNLAVSTDMVVYLQWQESTCMQAWEFGSEVFHYELWITLWILGSGP